MDEVEPIISRLNGIDPSRPYFDPLAAEEALRRHTRLIGFLDPSFSWAMGPREAAHELSGVDFASPAGCRWQMTMQALHDQAVADLQRDQAAWQTYGNAQDAAETRIAETLHLEPNTFLPLAAVAARRATTLHIWCHRLCGTSSPAARSKASNLRI